MEITTGTSEMLSEDIQECVALLDMKFGEGFAVSHPDLVIQLLQAYELTSLHNTLDNAFTGGRTNVNIYEKLVEIEGRLDDIRLAIA